MTLTMLPPQNSGGVEYNMKAEDQPQHEELGTGETEKIKTCWKEHQTYALKKTYKNLDYNKKRLFECSGTAQEP